VKTHGQSGSQKLGLDQDVTFERYDPNGFDHMRMPGYALEIPSEPEELISDCQSCFLQMPLGFANS